MEAAELEAAFARDGFLVVPGVLGAQECREWKAECQALLAAVRAESPGKTDAERFPGGVFVGLAQRSPLFAAAAGDARLLPYLHAALGPNVEFLSDKVVWKDRREEQASPWHQDYEYWGGPHKISVWIALDDATIENGCLQLIPGSHRGTVRHDQVASTHGFGRRVIDQDVASATSAPLAAGGVVVFSDLTLHASHPNASGADRWAVITTYRDASATEEERMAWPAARIVAGHGPGARRA